MAVNDNGFEVSAIDYSSNHSSMSEAAIIGISFSWIIGIISLYILGMCGIRFWFKRKQN